MKNIKFIKKSFIFAGLLLLGTSLFAGPQKVMKKNQKPKIVCTIFPEYDWTREILGENINDFDLSLIVDNGVDLHSFQPSVADGINISTADVLIYIGGHSDNWVTDFLSITDNENLKVINLMNVLENRLQKTDLIEGMEHDNHHHHHNEHNEAEHEDDHDHHEHHHCTSDTCCMDHDYDEHIWLSLENAKLCSKEIAYVLSERFPEYKDSFNKNLSNYLLELEKLDSKYRHTVKHAKNKTLIFCDRFPFRYLTEDYGLKYYAAFTGCSAESEASFETIRFLADKLKETGVKTVLTIENSNNKIANTVKKSAKRPGTKILVMDSMQATTLKMALSGDTYLSVMTKNLETLKKALE